jgi:hypothetical protein
MSWTRTNAFATIDTYVEKQYKFGRLDTSSNFVQSEFSATPAGSFFGSSVGAPVTPTGITIGTSANSQTLKAKFGALKNR